MHFIQTTLIVLVALIHYYFLYLEMFLWTKPQGMKSFGMDQEFAERTKILGANQGLYNGFLATGLIWSLLSENNSAIIFFYPALQSQEFMELLVFKKKMFSLCKQPQLLLQLFY